MKNNKFETEVERLQEIFENKLTKKQALRAAQFLAETSARNFDLEKGIVTGILGSSKMGSIAYFSVNKKGVSKVVTKRDYQLGRATAKYLTK